MPLKNVRYRTIKRGGKTVRLAFSKSTGKTREAKVIKTAKGKRK